jgi:hypothetical protein
VTTPSPTTIDSLARSWDDLVLSSQANPDLASDDTSEILHTLHRPASSLNADPQFVARLQRELLEAWRLGHHQTEWEADASPTRSLGTAPPMPLRPSRRRSRHAPHVASVFATAALVLLTFISAVGMLASAWQPTFDRERITGVISAPVIHDPATALGVLASFRVPELPPTLGRMIIERWTYPPHAEAVTTEKMTGPLLLYVIKGEVTVALTGGEAMLLGEERGPLNLLSSLSTSTGRISAGQALLLPAQTQMTTSNEGDDEAILVAATAFADTINDWTLPYDQMIIKQEVLGSTFAMFPTGPVEIALQRSVIAPGESIPPAPPEGVIQLVGSESEVLAYLRRAPDGSVTNLEDVPLSVLVVTITATG